MKHLYTSGKIIITLFIVGVVVTGGCSKKTPDVNACNLLTKAEVVSLSTDIVGHDFFPKKGNKPQVCAWHDGENKNLVTLFFYDSAQNNPMELIKTGMKGKKSRITAITGVGIAAAAAFAPSLANADIEEMSLFAAKNEKGMIVIRAKNIGAENSDKFKTLASLAKTALSRIK